MNPPDPEDFLYSRQLRHNLFVFNGSHQWAPRPHFGNLNASWRVRILSAGEEITMRNRMGTYCRLLAVALFSCASMAYGDQATMSHRPTLSDPPAPGSAYTIAVPLAIHQSTIIATAACYDLYNETHVDESPCFTFTTLPLPQWCRLTGADVSGPFESGDHANQDAGDLGGQFEILRSTHASGTRAINVGQFDVIPPQNNTIATQGARIAAAEISPLSHNPAAGSTQNLALLSPPAGAASPLPANENSAGTARFEGAKWNSGSVITWSIADRPGTADSPFSGYMGSRYEALVQQGFQAWAAASGLTFEEVADSSQSDIRLGWGNFDTSSTRVVGYTAFEMQSGQLQPNVIVRLEDPSQDSLVAGTGNAPIYSGTDANLGQVILHEIGHALGLADNRDPNSVMYYEATGSNNTLDGNDVAGIQTLYGSLTLATQELRAAASEAGTRMSSLSR